MTDEEMAEEYRKSLKQRLIAEDEFERLEMFDENVEEAYLAGLKAGRPKWHKVADGGDLPKHENYVLVSNGKDWTKAFYKDGKWNVISLVGFLHVIAWKEIELPKE